MRSSRGGEEGSTGGMLRAPELVRRPEEHDPALLQQPDRAAEQQPLAHVVRHEDDRLAETPLQREELALQLDARDGIERPERLIEQEERRIGGQRPRDADPLALPARQLVRVARAEHAGIETDQGEELAHARGDALGGPPPEPRPPHLEDRAHAGPASAIRNRRSSLVPCHRTASPTSPRIRSRVSGAYL